MMSVPTLVRCIGCGLPLGDAGEPPSQGALDHVFGCLKHPVAKELRATRNILDAAIQAGIDGGLRTAAFWAIIDRARRELQSN